jgi:streptogramin lyase
MKWIACLSASLLAFGTRTPAQQPAARVWTLVEDLRIGADDGPKSFTDVRGIVETTNGNIFVLDFKPHVIRLFDSKGNFIKQVARDGAGPGEIRNANGMAVGPDGIVWVNDPSNSRFSLFNPDGSFNRQIVIPIRRYGYIWEGVVDSRGRAIDVISGPTTQDRATGVMRGESLLRLTSVNGEQDTLPFPTCSSGYKAPEPPYLQFQSGRGSMMMALPFLPAGRMLVTAKGHTWCTTSGEYRLWSGPLGQPNREVVSIRMDPPRVTDAERQQALDRIDSLTRAYGKMTVGDPSRIPRVKPVVDAIHGDPQGRVWVRLTETPAATPAFDVYNVDGKPVARIRSTGKVSKYQTWITETHVYTVVVDEDDVPTIVRYRIVK